MKTFAHKGCKVAAAKKVFFTDFFYLFTLYKSLFAPTFRSPMSKLFKFLESLGKNNEKKWSQILKLLLTKGVKSPWRKKFFLQIFFICSLRLNVFLPPLPKVKCPNILDFRNPCGKVTERSGLRFENFCS